MSKKSLINFSLLMLVAGSTLQSPLAGAAAQPSADLIALRTETRQLEQQMYDIYNRLNSNDEFDVACDEKKVTGSLIPEWLCEAAFLRNARSNDASTRFDNALSSNRSMGDGYIPQSGRQISFKNRKKVEELNADMLSLARQHTELAAAMIAFNDKRQQLERLEK